MILAGKGRIYMSKPKTHMTLDDRIAIQEGLNLCMKKSAGSHSQKMLFAEIQVLLYLITFDSHASRHNPLLLKTYVFYLHGQQCYPLQVCLRTKRDSATPFNPS